MQKGMLGRWLAAAVMVGLLWPCPGAALEEVEGRVIKVDGLTVEISIDSQTLPREGDMVDIQFTVPGAGEVSIGSWKVSAVRPGVATAKVVEHTGTPRVGQTAVIFSTGDDPTGSGNAGVPMEPNKTPAPVTPGAMGGGVASAPASKYRADLASGDAQRIRAAARGIYDRKDFSPAVLADVDQALRRGYAAGGNDRLHVDAMAWLCRVLGAGGDRRYGATLEKVASQGSNRKLRKYAQQSLRQLR